MKKIFLLLAVSILTLASFAQITISQGDNKILSLYTGADPTEFTLAGTSGKWYELIVVTGTLTTVTSGFEILSQHWGGTGTTDPTYGWRQADANGIAKFLFNASLKDDIVERSHQYGWLIPPGIYQFAVREYYNTEPLQTISIEIVGEATTAIQAATVAVRKARGKK